MKKLKICLVLLCLLTVRSIGMPQFHRATFFMKQIELTKGKVALVDDEDYDALMNYRWWAHPENRNCYAATSIGSNEKQRRLRMHRVVLQVDNPKIIIDHKNGNGLDNQKSNLRICSNSQNSQNRRMKKCNKIGFKGISYKPTHKAYQASINVNGKFIFGGHFRTALEAAKKYNELALIHHGEFARLNPIPNE